jgi:hypothetical protein
VGWGWGREGKGREGKGQPKLGVRVEVNENDCDEMGRLSIPESERGATTTVIVNHLRRSKPKQQILTFENPPNIYIQSHNLPLHRR